MRSIREPLTLPKHPELLHKINETKIAIKLSYLASPEIREKLETDKREINPPSWDDIIDLLDNCYKAINEQREDPRKY
jgi:hypothetical protein